MRIQVDLGQSDVSMKTMENDRALTKKQKQSQQNKKYHESNREVILARKRKNYQLTKDQPKIPLTEEELTAKRKYDREYKRKMRLTESGKERQDQNDKRYRDRNKLKIQQRRKDRYAANRQVKREANKAYYRANAEKLKKDKRDWCKSNRDRVRISEKAIEHKRRAAAGKLTSYDILMVLEHSCGICPYCLHKIDLKQSQIEHCVPLSRGGINSIENVVASCEKCNKQKNNKTPLEYLLNWPKVTDRYATETK